MTDINATLLIMAICEIKKYELKSPKVYQTNILLISSTEGCNM